MRVVALISFLFGLLGLMLLDGQVFTHAVQGIVCGAVTISCGLASARKDRSRKMLRWVGYSLGGLGLLLAAFSVAQLPGAYKSQTKFNERSSGRTQERPKLAALARKLVGTWTHGQEKPGIGWSGGVTTILQDGTWSSSATNLWDGGSRRFAYEGTWGVTDGTLVVTYTKSSEPKDVPVGTSQRYEIVQIDDRELAFREPSQDVTNILVMRRSGSRSDRP